MSTSPGLDFAAGDQLVLVHDADDEAGQVVFAIGVEAGHLRGFAADEGASVGTAGLGEAAHHGFCHFSVEPAGGQVVEEEQRRRTLYRDVVHAVIDQVGAHGVVHAEGKGDFELGADAVGARNQDWVGIFRGVEAEEPAKAADVAQDRLGEGLLCEVLDALLGAIALGDVDSSGGIGDGGLGCFFGGFWHCFQLRQGFWIV